MRDTRAISASCHPTPSAPGSAPRRSYSPPRARYCPALRRGRSGTLQLSRWTSAVVLSLATRMLAWQARDRRSCRIHPWLVQLQSAALHAMTFEASMGPQPRAPLQHRSSSTPQQCTSNGPPPSSAPSELHASLHRCPARTAPCLCWSSRCRVSLQVVLCHFHRRLAASHPHIPFCVHTSDVLCTRPTPVVHHLARHAENLLGVKPQYSSLAIGLTPHSD
jgi:hypothetical protein